MQEKILDILKETINNQYFYYLILTMILFSVLKNIWDYDAYKKDCKILGQKVKIKGYIRNTIDDIILISIISIIGFMGYKSLDYAENEPEPAQITQYIENIPTNTNPKKETTILKETQTHKPIKMTIMETSYQQKKIDELKNKLIHSKKREYYITEKLNKRIRTLEKEIKKIKERRKTKKQKRKEVLYMRNGKVFKKEFVYE